MRVSVKVIFEISAVEAVGVGVLVGGPTCYFSTCAGRKERSNK